VRAITTENIVACTVNKCEKILEPMMAKIDEENTKNDANRDEFNVNKSRSDKVIKGYSVWSSLSSFLPFDIQYIQKKIKDISKITHIISIKSNNINLKGQNKFIDSICILLSNNKGIKITIKAKKYIKNLFILIFSLPIRY
jgi:hypothetical protein